MLAPSILAARYLRNAGIAALAVVTVAVIGYAGAWLDLHASAGNARSAIVFGIIFFAATISSVVGFAFSAIAGAMILHYESNPIEAVQIMMVASIGIQSYSVTRLWSSIRWSRCAPFIAGGITTLPLGIGALKSLPLGSYVPVMGMMLVGYGLYMLLRRPMARRCGRRPIADALVGAVGGLTGPIAALPGMGLTIWCGMRGWNKVEQRAVYQPYILVMQILAFAALCFTQRQRFPEPALLAYGLPGLAGAIIGLRVFHALNDQQFQRFLNVALIVAGFALTIK